MFKNITIEWKGSEHRILSESVFKILESWEDDLGLTTFEIYGWATDPSKIKPLKAARAFSVLLSYAGCKGDDASEVAQYLHYQNSMQQGIFSALFSVAQMMIPPEEFVQESENEIEKKSLAGA